MLTTLLLLPLALRAEHLPPGVQKVIDVGLPARSLNSTAAAITLSAKLETDFLAGEVGADENLVFTSMYQGHLNTWKLNLTTGMNSSEIYEQEANKTLCFKPGYIRDSPKRFVTLVAFSNAHVSTEVSLSAAWKTDFLLPLDTQVRTEVVPGSSQVFQFSPPPSYREEEDESYLLTVSSVTNPSLCLYVAINPPGCPWLDSPSTVHNSQQYARMLNTSYFPIRARDFPDSFTVALVPVVDSRSCRSRHSKEWHLGAEGSKVVTLTIQKTGGSYTLPITVSLVAIVGFCLLFFVTWIFCWKAQLHNNKKRILERMKFDRNFRESVERQTSGMSTTNRCPSCSQDYVNGITGRETPEQLILAKEIEITPANALRQKLAAAIEEKDSLKVNRHTEKKNKTGYAVNRLLKDRLNLKDMSIALKDAWHRRQRSKVYLYLVPLISIFYLVPSAQMVYAEAKKFRESGNRELCYLNYGCSRPLGIFADFNHIISNSGYIIYGIVFIFLVRLKSIFLPQENRTETDHLGKIGLPQQHSIFYCMGLCCILQGVFSAIFHVCPSNISLQFDTTMMYVMLLLVFIKLYQFRHPDVATNAYHAMYGFSVALVLEAISLYVFSPTAKIIFYFIFSLFYTCTVLHIATDSYYYGAIKSNFLSLLPIFLRHSLSLSQCRDCLYPRRLVLSIAFVIINMLLMMFTLMRSTEEGARSLSTPILIIYAVNCGLFLSYYMFRKVIEIVKNRHEGEGKTLRWISRLFSFFFLVLALVLAMVAMSYYTARHQSRNSTPPESRDRNEPCNVLDFFDNHDMWHFFSATALFLAFIFLLTIDDDILLEDREKIDVF